MKISSEFDAIVGFAREEAMRTGSYSICADHLFLGILRHRDNAAVAAMQQQGVDIDECKRSIDAQIFHEHSIPFSEEEQIRLGHDGSSAVNMAIAEAMTEGADEAGPMHLLRAVCRQQDNHAGEYLRRKGVCDALIAKTTSKARVPKTPASPDTMPSAAQMARLLGTIRINNKIVS